MSQPTSEPHSPASLETREMALPLAPPNLSQGATHVAGSAIRLPHVFILITWWWGLWSFPHHSASLQIPEGPKIPH